MGGYTCTCTSAYTGTNCDQYGKWELSKKSFFKIKISLNLITIQKKALPCNTGSPCYNGATCTNNYVGGYTCKCATGYTGTNCQYSMS